MENVYPVDIVYDGTTERIDAERVIDNIYKCVESCIFIDFITYGCEIEVEEVDGKLNFLGLYKESPFQTFYNVW